MRQVESKKARKQRNNIMTHITPEAREAQADRAVGIIGGAVASEFGGDLSGEKATTITIERIDSYPNWRALAGRLVLQWRDSCEASDFLLVTGTDDGKAAIDREMEDYDPAMVSSTQWDETLTCYRVLGMDAIRAAGYSDDDVLDAFAHRDEEIILEAVECASLTIEPTEPTCMGKSGRKPHKRHKWTTGQAYGHGGGIVREDTCRRCGLHRTFDSWATDPTNGSQGHESTWYSEPGCDSKLELPGRVEIEFGD